MGQEVAGLVHDLDPHLPVGYADVHVQPEDQQLADHVLELLLEQLVALQLGDLLLLPVREGVGARRGDPQAGRLEERRQCPPQAKDLSPGFVHAGADPGGDLDHRLQHLRLQLLAQRRFARRQQGADVRLQLSRLVDDLELFLDPHGQPVAGRGRHAGPSTT